MPKSKHLGVVACRRRRFKIGDRVTTEFNNNGRVVGLHFDGEYLVVIDGTELPMRYHGLELKFEQLESSDVIQ